MSKRKKIIFFVTEDWYFFSHRLPLAVAAKEAGYDVSVITRVKKLGDEIKKSGIKVIPLTLSRRGKNVFKELNVLWQLIKIYKNEKPDIVHHVALKPVLYGSAIAHLLKVPYVVNALPGLGILFSSLDYKYKFIRPLVLFLIRVFGNRKNCRMILQNPDDVELIRRKAMADSRICLIRGSGVDTNKYQMKKEVSGDIMVILASRLLWEKGVGEFVSAAKQINKKNIAVRFVLVGRSDYHNPSSIPEKQLKEWHEQGIVEWWGLRSKMENIFTQSHIVCLPTMYREGVPKVLIEAASCGKPIITTDSPGCREIVQDGINGILVPTKDSKALEKAILKLVKSPNLRETMGKKGRDLVLREFSLEIVNKETLSVYANFYN